MQDCVGKQVVNLGERVSWKFGRMMSKASGKQAAYKRLVGRAWGFELPATVAAFTRPLAMHFSLTHTSHASFHSKSSRGHSEPLLPDLPGGLLLFRLTEDVDVPTANMSALVLYTKARRAAYGLGYRLK